MTVYRDRGRPLSARELQVLEQIARGRSNGEIASELYIAPSTVKFHMKTIFCKLGARNRAHAVYLALTSGLIDTTAATPLGAA